MVDMVEARKRARKAAAQPAVDLTGPTHEPEQPAQPKPILRSETVPQPPEKINYFPVDIPLPEPAAPEHEPVEPLPLQIAEEDQVDFVQKLFSTELEEEEIERLAAEASQREEMEVLIFQLGNEQYGMDIQLIAEIIRFMEPTEVPNTVGFLDGIISLRGRMIPVINGRKRLGHPPKTPDKKSRIIVLNDNAEYHGILVDSASQVVRLPKNEIEPTPSVVVGVDAEFINGVCEYKKQLIILLNLDRFLQF